MIDGLIIQPDKNTKWNEWYDKLKSGAHMIVIAPQYHYRTMVRVENSNFEIRDTIIYHYRDKQLPLILTRKPISENSIAENCVKWGTGGINIDECRVGTEGEDLTKLKAFGSMPKNKVDGKGYSRPWMSDKNKVLEKQNSAIEKMKDKGRFPANIILDEEAGRQLDEQSGVSVSRKRKNPSTREDTSTLFNSIGVTNTGEGEYDDEGGASRFFQQSNTIDELIDYLTTLIQPPQGKVVVEINTDPLNLDAKELK